MVRDSKLKLFELFHKGKYSSDREVVPTFHSPELLAKEIEKAVRFIKVKQFHSGFPEISSPEQGGDIEVSIEQDPAEQNLFHINFRFVSIPGRVTVLQEQKLIDYPELKRLATEYDNQKEQIDEELNYRDSVVKNATP